MKIKRIISLIESLNSIEMKQLVSYLQEEILPEEDFNEEIAQEEDKETIFRRKIASNFIKRLKQEFPEVGLKKLH